MKTLNFLLIGVLIVLTNSCNWFEPVEPKDPNRTYHWEGTLYKGVGEEVWPNANVNLTGAHRTLAGPKYNTIAQGVTDANGHFRLEYTIDSTDSKYENEIGASYGVSFEVNGGYPLMDAPWKRNLDRDICEIDHSTLILYINLSENYSDEDTLFVYSAINEVDLLQKNLNFKKTTLNNGIVTRLSFIVHPADTLITIKQRYASSYKNSPSRHLANNGIGLKDIIQRVSAYYDENDDTEFEHESEYFIRGWPYSDTLLIEF